MTKHRAVAWSVAGLFSTMLGVFLVNSAQLFWVGAVLLGLGVAGLLIGALWLWGSVLSFFATIAVLTVVLGTTALHGPPLWLSAFGESRTDCQVLDAKLVKSTKSPSRTIYTVQCGDRRIEYEPYQTVSEYIGDVGERTSLVFDRTGLMDPLRPSDLTDTARWAVPGAALFGLLYIWVLATVLFAWSRRKKPRVVDQELT